jgi:hypothetical protein
MTAASRHPERLPGTDLGDRENRPHVPMASILRRRLRR